MANKRKKNQKHRTFHQAIKPFIKDSRVLYTLLGAVGTGVAIGAAFGSEKGGALVERITAAVKQLGQPSLLGEMIILGNENKPATQIKSSKSKKTKPFATE